MEDLLRFNRPASQVIAKIPFFKDLDKDSVELIAQKMQIYKVNKSDLIVREGDETKKMYFVLDGVVNVFRINYRGQKDTICELSNPNYFGEMSIIDGGPRSASVEAKTDVVLAELKWDDVKLLFDNKPEIMCYIFKNIGSTLSMRLRRVNSLYAKMTSI